VAGLDLGIDIDNVLYPWTTTVTRWVERRKGLAPGTLDDHALSWTWFKDQWGMTSEEFGEHFKAGIQAGVVFAQGDPAAGSVAAMRRLHVAGHRLHYVTDRLIAGDAAYDVTHTWLHDAGYPVDSITITADKASVQTDVFLDDAPHNIQALDLAGHPAPVIWDRPHNRRATNLGHRTRRVFNWHQFEALVQAEAGDLSLAAA
jgi:hypothetical protein